MTPWSGPSLVLLALIVLSASPVCAVTFEQFARRHDGNGDGIVKEDEFKGPRARFHRLDGNQDGQVSRSEFEANRRRAAPGSMPAGAAPRRDVADLMPPKVRTYRDLEYASVDGRPLTLDLYVPPPASAPFPLVVWYHGGGWSRGDKGSVNPLVAQLVGAGYAVASVNYRLGGVSLHPAQLHDCKGAIRWLRANAARYDLDPSRIAAAGGSAGAHLALLVGLTAGSEALEGTVGGNLTESSRVRAVVDLFGPADLVHFAGDRPDFARSKSIEVLTQASPIMHVSKDDPPLLILHGELDPVVPVDQSRMLQERCRSAGLESRLELVRGAGHGGREFSDPERFAMVRDFLGQHLAGNAERGQRSAAGRTGPASVDDRSRQRQPSPATVPDRQRDRLAHNGFHWMVGPKAGLEGPSDKFDRLLEEIDANLSRNQVITGVYVILHWNAVEGTPGEPDFSRLERVLERIERQGRYYKLAIVPGIYTPDWVYGNGAKPFVTVGSNPDRPDSYEQTVRVPIPWDPVYQDRYFRLMASVAQRFGDRPGFHAITLSVAAFMSPEWHLPDSPEDLKRWSREAGFPGALEQAWRQGIDRFARLFPKQLLVLEASSYPVNLKALGDSVVHHAATHYPGRLAIQINQLTGRYDQLGRPTYDKLLTYRQKYGSDLIIGLQNLKGWEFPDGREAQGTMQMTTYNFVQAGGAYWELWHGDGANPLTCETLERLRAEAVRTGLPELRARLQREGLYIPPLTRARRAANPRQHENRTP